MELIAFPDRAAAAAATAAALADGLRAALRTRPHPAFVVSGGTTPCESLARLAAASLPWQQIAVTLTDERAVPADDPRSNERMVREWLLRDAAAQLRFLPLVPGVEKELPLPFACVLIGMGGDGHIAGIFPDLPERQELLDPEGPAAVRRVVANAEPPARITMSLSLLLHADQVMLLAFGEEKRSVLTERVALPVHALVAQARVPVRIFWAP